MRSLTGEVGESVSLVFDSGGRPSQLSTQDLGPPPSVNSLTFSDFL